MHRFNNNLLKIRIYLIFLLRGVCKHFCKLHIEKLTDKSDVYIKHYIIRCKHRKYILALGTNWLQKKKVRNAVRYEKEIASAYKDFFKFNNCIKKGRFLFLNYAIYNYFDNVTPFSSDQDFEYALNAAKTVYEKADYYKITTKNVDNFILRNIKIIVPYMETSKIVKSKEFQELKAKLLKISKIKCAPQHGDYNLPNMLKYENNFYLVDLERTMPNMFAGYDWYHLLKGNKNGWFNPVESEEMKAVPDSDLLKLFIGIFIGKEPDKL